MIVLASTSATRQKILRNAGLDFTSEKPGVDESAIREKISHLSPPDQALALAKLKAEAVSMRLPDAITIGADQVLELNGKVFHKPMSKADAIDQLTELQGKTHNLHSAVVVLSGQTPAHEILKTATLRMRTLDSQAIAAYLAKAGPDILSAVGCYHIEGLGIQLFDDFTGDIFTIMGLPLLPLLAHLRQHGHVAP